MNILYHTEGKVEKLLQMNADIKKIPLGGALELLPLCNMDCKMCYVRKTKAEMESEGRMLLADEWLRILDEGVKEGMLFLLLTGGEPLLYPDFKYLYKEARKKGLILSVNTNGTLIDREWAEFFAKYGCRRLNITLYGKDDATYKELCNNPIGFTQVMNACQLLKEYKVPFRLTCSVTPNNVDQLDEIVAVAERLDVPISMATYMFPGVRRGNTSCTQYRLTPKESVEANIRYYKLTHPDADIKEVAQRQLSKLDLPIQNPKGEGFSCHAGHSGFWMNWKGELLPCGMFVEPRISMLEHSFAECWKYIVETTHVMQFCEDCKTCDKRNMCSVCPAQCYTETGMVSGKPEYICEMTEEMICQLKEILFAD